jgi:hypothetical protein
MRAAETCLMLRDTMFKRVRMPHIEALIGAMEHVGPEGHCAM